MQTKKTSHLLNQNKSKRWEYYKILKNPPLVPLNDIGVPKGILNQMKDRDCQNENKKHNRRHQINIRFYLSADAASFFVPFHDFTSCS